MIEGFFIIDGKNVVWRCEVPAPDPVPLPWLVRTIATGEDDEPMTLAVGDTPLAAIARALDSVDATDPANPVSIVGLFDEAGFGDPDAFKVALGMSPALIRRLHAQTPAQNALGASRIDEGAAGGSDAGSDGPSRSGTTEACHSTGPDDSYAACEACGMSADEAGPLIEYVGLAVDEPDGRWMVCADCAEKEGLR